MKYAVIIMLERFWVSGSSFRSSVFLNVLFMLKFGDYVFGGWLGITSILHNEYRVAFTLRLRIVVLS